MTGDGNPQWGSAHLKTLYHRPGISFGHYRRRKVYLIGWAYQAAFWLALFLIGIHALNRQNSSLREPKAASIGLERASWVNSLGHTIEGIDR
jgi:hypothetical protein